MLEYKSEWYEKQVQAVAKNVPSSQLCSHCVYHNKAVKHLALGKWKYLTCGIHHDRNMNAGKNIRHEAMRLSAGYAEIT